MFQFIIGSIIGFFGGFVFFIAILLTDIKFDVSVATNLIIALATVVAAVIHFSSIKQQRKDRLWDINRDLCIKRQRHTTRS